MLHCHFAAWFATLLAVVLAPSVAAAQEEYSSNAVSRGEPVRVVRPAAQLPPALRRPVALALVEQGKRLLVANRDTGTVSIIDTQQQRLLAEQQVAPRLDHLVALPDGQHVLAIDGRNHRLLALRFAGDRLHLLTKTAVPPYPVQVAVSRDGRWAWVSSLWSRRVSRWELVAGEAGGLQTLQPAGAVRLPFCPRALLPLECEDALLVADGFGGQIAVVELPGMKLAQVREIPAHNIRAMRLHPRGTHVLVAHQILNDLARTTHNDVHWGVLMSNVLRWVPLSNLMRLDRPVLQGTHVHLLGDSRFGGADPTDVAVTVDYRVIVTLGGADHVAVGRQDDYVLQRYPVGRNPVAVVLGPRDRVAWVANRFDDTVSVFQLSPPKLLATVSLGPQRPRSLPEKGEELFYSGRLAMDRWMSCHSCHTDGHTNGLLNDNLSDGTFGAPKRVLSLLGTGGTAPWAWNGSRSDLHVQIRASIQATMRGTEPDAETVNALAAFLRQLPPAPGVGRFDKADPALVRRGQQVFQQRGCVECHRPPEYTTPDVYDVGLADSQGLREFNPPSLRGVSQRYGLFHDKRAKSLKEVFTRFGHGLEGKPLDPQELEALLAFLRSL